MAISKQFQGNTIKRPGAYSRTTTDQNSGSFPTAKKLLRFVFYLPPPGDMSRLLKLTEMALHFIDRVAATHLSTQVKFCCE